MTYTVQSGDSMWGISRRFGSSLKELLDANPQISTPDLIYPGQIINIPSAPPRKDRFRAPEPYPEVRVEGKNTAYAMIVRQDYAGRVSEISAVMQYLYHQLEMEQIPGWQEVSQLEKGISIVEMYHMEILGQILRLLGTTPRYEADNKLWTPAYVVYCDFDPCAQLRADIQGEREAIAQYEKHIREINDRYIQAILLRIIKDEQHHIQLLSDSLARQCV